MQKDTIVLRRIPFQSCLVIKKGLHGEGVVRRGVGGRDQGIGLVGNLAKKQRADLLCSWQAWEPARMNPTPPLTHSLPAEVLFSVCGHAERLQTKRKERFRLWQSLQAVCLFLCTDNVYV